MYVPVCVALDEVGNVVGEIVLVGGSGLDASRYLGEWSVFVFLFHVEHWVFLARFR